MTQNYKYKKIKLHPDILYLDDLLWIEEKIREFIKIDDLIISYSTYFEDELLKITFELKGEIFTEESITGLGIKLKKGKINHLTNLTFASIVITIDITETETLINARVKSVNEEIFSQIIDFLKSKEDKTRLLPTKILFYNKGGKKATKVSKTNLNGTKDGTKSIVKDYEEDTKMVSIEDSIVSHKISVSTLWTIIGAVATIIGVIIGLIALIK